MAKHLKLGASGSHYVQAELRTILEERLQPTLAMGVSHLAQLHREGQLPSSLVSALGQWLLDHEPMKVGS